LRCCQQMSIRGLRIIYQSLKRLVSLSPILAGSYPRCSALRMITGNALEYLAAFARCCPPHPLPAVEFLRTRPYSIRHCLNRIRLGMLMINGTIYAPPQPRSGRSVLLTPHEKNIHKDTNRSPKTLEYEVSTSARRISPNLPSWASAMPPIETRLRV